MLLDAFMPPTTQPDKHCRFFVHCFDFALEVEIGTSYNGNYISYGYST
jgi:hypothetical protein